MAHNCPVCGDVCFCNGDVSDLVEDSKTARDNCEHYRLCETEPADIFQDEDDGLQ